MNVIGLDIGTTTVCAVVVDSETGKVLRSVTEPNDTFIESSAPYERIQSPALILAKCSDIVGRLCSEFSPVACIGVTGQMHGILYCDKNGSAISPLYIWQDESGNERFDRCHSYAAYLTEETGHKMASGFGCTTYFVHANTNAVPKNAVCFCTIHDYVAMRLTGRETPLVHVSDAASFGLFDLKTLRFDWAAVQKVGLDISLFPEITKEFEPVGYYKDSIPVCVAVGDNQASFLGSVRDTEHSVLVNLGTGGQISFLTRSVDDAGLEIRPCYGENYLCVGSSLCGGRAFALMEEFLRKTAEFVTGKQVKSAYPAIDEFLADNPVLHDPLRVSTRFAGTREHPSERASVTNLGLDNFTPQHLILGVLDGIADELLSMYMSSDHGGRHTSMIGSGNGLRKNPALQRLLSERFGMKLLIPVHREEAAFGAALTGMTAAGLAENIEQAQKLISYE